VNLNFAQLTKKIEKLKKALKKSGNKVRKRRYKDSDSNYPNRELCQEALGK
jgi:hypothetical protein